MSIRIIRRNPPSAPGAPESPSVSIDELTDQLLELVEALRQRLLAVYDLSITEEQWCYLELDEGPLPRSLLLALLHAATAEDFEGDLTEFTEQFEFDYGSTTTLVVSIGLNQDGAPHASLIDPGYDCPIHVAGNTLEDFLDQSLWRETALRWLLRELGATPHRIEATLAGTLPRGRS